MDDPQVPWMGQVILLINSGEHITEVSNCQDLDESFPELSNDEINQLNALGVPTTEGARIFWLEIGKFYFTLFHRRFEAAIQNGIDIADWYANIVNQFAGLDANWVNAIKLLKKNAWLKFYSNFRLCYDLDDHITKQDLYPEEWLNDMGDL